MAWLYRQKFRKLLVYKQINHLNADFPYGGIKVAVKAAEAYGYHVSEEKKHIFTEYRKTHNQVYLMPTLNV